MPPSELVIEGDYDRTLLLAPDKLLHVTLVGAFKGDADDLALASDDGVLVRDSNKAEPMVG